LIYCVGGGGGGDVVDVVVAVETQNFASLQQNRKEKVVAIQVDTNTEPTPIIKI
jgi:hypothetical protein